MAWPKRSPCSTGLPVKICVLVVQTRIVLFRDNGERVVLGAMLADLTNFLSPLLRRLDRMSMAASVECRVPFLDHRLVKKAVNLPLSYRLHGSIDKWILKEIAAHYLPKDLVHRNKVGFPLPLQDYLAPLAREELLRGFLSGISAAPSERTLGDHLKMET